MLAPGVYHVPKEIPQGKVVIGKRAIERDDPDAIPLDLLNDILGGSGFTSRIMQQVRSNEGLAYSAASGLAPKVDYPGQFQARFESVVDAFGITTIVDVDLRVSLHPLCCPLLQLVQVLKSEFHHYSHLSKFLILRSIL